MTKIQIGDIVVYANKRCMVADTSDKYVDLRWVIDGAGLGWNRWRGSFTRRVPLTDLLPVESDPRDH